MEPRRSPGADDRRVEHRRSIPRCEPDSGPYALEASDYTVHQDLTGLPAGRDVSLRVTFQGLDNARALSKPGPRPHRAARRTRARVTVDLRDLEGASVLRKTLQPELRRRVGRACAPRQRRPRTPSRQRTRSTAALNT
jgi:hypothetical protein